MRNKKLNIPEIIYTDEPEIITCKYLLPCGLCDYNGLKCPRRKNISENAQKLPTQIINDLKGVTDD